MTRTALRQLREQNRGRPPLEGQYNAWSIQAHNSSQPGWSTSAQQANPQQNFTDYHKAWSTEHQQTSTVPKEMCP